MLRVGLMCLAVTVMLGLTVAQDKKEKTTAELFLGKWKLKKTSQPLPPGFEGTLEVKEKGVMILTMSNDGKTQKLEGKWDLVGEKGKETKVKTFIKIPSGKEVEETLKLEKLTDKELIMVDEADKKDIFERIKDDKK
jgi:uncharacterized protein (TIGR03066 family)